MLNWDQTRVLASIYLCIYFVDKFDRYIKKFWKKRKPIILLKTDYLGGAYAILHGIV